LLKPLAAMGFRRFHGGFSLNVLNHLAARTLARLGLESVTLSFESGFDNMHALISGSPIDVHAPAHGWVPGMLADYCLAHETAGCSDPRSCELESGGWALLDQAGGLHGMYREEGCRVAISTTADLCVLPWLADFVQSGVKGLRLGLEHHEPGQVATTVAIYRRHLDACGRGEAPQPESVQESLGALAEHSPRPLGVGAYRHGCLRISEEGRELEKILVGAAVHS
jgi:putative protease